MISIEWHQSCLSQRLTEEETPFSVVIVLNLYLRIRTAGTILNKHFYEKRLSERFWFVNRFQWDFLALFFQFDQFSNIFGLKLNHLQSVQWTARHPVLLYVSTRYTFWIAQSNHADVFAFVVCCCCCCFLEFWLFIHSLFFRYFFNIRFFFSLLFFYSALLHFTLLLSYRVSFISSSYSSSAFFHHNRHHNHHPCACFTSWMHFKMYLCAYINKCINIEAIHLLHRYYEIEPTDIGRVLIQVPLSLLVIDAWHPNQFHTCALTDLDWYSFTHTHTNTLNSIHSLTQCNWTLLLSYLSNSTPCEIFSAVIVFGWKFYQNSNSMRN